MLICTCTNKRTQGKTIEYEIQFDGKQYKTWVNNGTQGKIVGYNIQFDGEQCRTWINREELKLKIKNNILKVTNMKLTSNNRLIFVKDIKMDYSKKAKIEFNRMLKQLYLIQKKNKSIIVLLYFTTMTLGFSDIQNEIQLSTLLDNNIIDHIHIKNLINRTELEINTNEFVGYKLVKNKLKIKTSKANTELEIKIL